MKRTQLLTRMAGLLVLLASCTFAPYTPSLTTGEALRDNQAFLYGRFLVPPPERRRLFGSEATMGLALRCSDNRRYLLQFSHEEPLQVVEVTPATCWVVGLVGAYPDGTVAAESRVPDGAFSDLHVRPGVGYYLGDFTATVGSSGGDFSGWVKSCADRYNETTRDMKSRYPNLAIFDTTDATLAD